MSFRWIGKSENGEEIILKRLKGCPVAFPSYLTPTWIEENAPSLRTGVVLDVETTGLDPKKDSIIEIAILPFQFHKDSHEVLSVGKPFTAFQDPGVPLSNEIKRLTGLTDEMIQGQQICWQTVNEVLQSAQVIIAHNARFDRAFLDIKSKTSCEKIWACSYKQIRWSEFGFNTSKLETLNIYHGFYTESHRALNDVEALLFLLSHKCSEDSTQTYLSELLHSARTPSVQVIASSTPFSTKDLLKARSYAWDIQNRFWHKTIPKTELNLEMKWLEEQVYLGTFAGVVREIGLHDTFKS